MKRFKVVFTVMFMYTVLLANFAYAQTEFDKVVNKKSGYTIEKPVDWTSAQKKNEGNEFTLITGPGKDQTETVSVTVIIEKTKSNSSEEYITKLISNYVATFKTFDLFERDHIKIKGEAFSYFTLRTDVDGVSYTMKTVFGLFDGKVYQINVVAPNAIYEKNKDKIERLIYSFDIS